jgi:hypothetical protein
MCQRTATPRPSARRTPGTTAVSTVVCQLISLATTYMAREVLHKRQQLFGVCRQLRNAA